jgi:aspartyl-tRNA(Asn)/glutamyl-tRNA(Gln) amidotransferase subunit A
MSSEFTRMTAAGLAAVIAAGEASAAEVTEAHLARIGAVEAQVHAFLHVAADSARAAARAVDERRAAGEALGPLAGVPLALKDVFTTEDMPTTCGSRILAGWSSWARPTWTSSPWARPPRTRLSGSRTTPGT